MEGVVSFNTRCHHNGVVVSPPSSRQLDSVSLVGSRMTSDFSPAFSVMDDSEMKDNVWRRRRPDSKRFEAHTPRSGVPVGHGSSSVRAKSSWKATEGVVEFNARCHSNGVVISPASSRQMHDDSSAGSIMTSDCAPGYFAPDRPVLKGSFRTRLGHDS